MTSQDGAISCDEFRQAVDLQIRCGRAVDSRDWRAFEDCFTADATTQLPRTGAHTDRAAMSTAVQEVVGRLSRTQHFLSNHSVERDAGGLMIRSYVMSQHLRDVDGEEKTFLFGGQYTDILEWHDGELRIRHRNLEIFWVQGDPTILD